jgi:hypothetical protein
METPITGYRKTSRLKHALILPDSAHSIDMETYNPPQRHRRGLKKAAQAITIAKRLLRDAIARRC